MENLTNLPIESNVEPETPINPDVTGEQEQAFTIESKQNFELEKQKIELKRQHQEQNNGLANKDKDLGWFGKALGGGDNLSNNIGGLVLFTCLVIVLITLFLDVCAPKTLETTKTRELLFGVIMTTLGFIFGSSKK